MNLLDFIRFWTVDFKPTIEAPFEGVWRLEGARRIDLHGYHNCHYRHERGCPDDFFLEFRTDKLRFFDVCTICPPEAPHPCPGCDDGLKEPFVPCVFDAKRGILRFEDSYYLIGRVSKVHLVVFNMEYLGSGRLVRERYLRICTP